MRKSPEEYFSSMTFDASVTDEESSALDAGDRAFVEKYLGSDVLKNLEASFPEPEPLPLLAPLPAPEASTPSPLPEIVIVKDPAPVIEIAPVKIESPPVQPQIAAEIQETIAETTVAVKQETIEKQPEIVVQAPKPTQAVEITTEQEIAPCEEETASIAETAQQAALKANQTVELSLREKLRQMPEIQVVSFLVSGQLFLLPVEGIQEVVRHMELIKVPQAPEFVAGAINLRGIVMPLINLSALLTNSPRFDYDPGNFIIITGTAGLRMGLIIDKVSSMHMIPQKKIIWNADSKLGDAAEFLSALIDLDDKVCGMIAPENITQKILPEYTGKNC